MVDVGLRHRLAQLMRCHAHGSDSIRKVNSKWIVPTLLWINDVCNNCITSLISAGNDANQWLITCIRHLGQKQNFSPLGSQSVRYIHFDKLLHESTPFTKSFKAESEGSTRCTGGGASFPDGILRQWLERSLTHHVKKTYMELMQFKIN